MYEKFKIDLCCAARCFYRRGIHKGIAGHLSIKIDNEKILANRFGPSFGSLMPSDLLILDMDANILEGKGYVNETIKLHCIIHKQNPKIKSLAHTHSPAVVAFGSLRVLPQPYDQHSCMLANEIAIVEEDYEGFTLNHERILPIANALNNNLAVLLPNHGSITRGDDIQQATVLMVLLEEMIKTQLAAVSAGRAMGVEARPILPKNVEITKKEIDNFMKLFPVWQIYWEDLMMELKETDPGLMLLREQFK